MAEKFFKAVLKLVEMNRDITKMELYNLSYMGCVLYPAINIIIGLQSENKIDLKDFLDLIMFEILVENN